MWRGRIPSPALSSAPRAARYRKYRKKISQSLKEEKKEKNVILNDIFGFEYIE